MLQINVHDPKIKLADLIEAAEKGEEILIVTDNQKTFKIIEVENSKKKFREFGTAKGQFEISDDFNAPIDDFDEL